MSKNSKQNVSHILVNLGAFVIVVAGMSAAKAILVPFLLAIFIAIISSPPLFYLQRKGVSTWLALLAVIVGVSLIGILVGMLVGSSVKDFSEALPGYETRLKEYVAVIVGWIDKTGIDFSDLALNKIFDPSAAMRFAGIFLNGLGNVLANGFLILMAVIFILLEASSFPRKLRVILGPDSSLSHFNDFLIKVKHYVAIKTLVSLGTGVLISIWLTILDVNYALLWGLLAFALNYVPNIGSIIAAVPAVLLAFIQFGMAKAVAAAAGFIVINLLMDNVIEPRFMGRGLGLSTLIVFLSLLFWGWVLGPVGMILSVPLTITAKIALDSREETQWLGILLGPETVVAPRKEAGQV
ncbi:MAG: AI-2E family transporter [Pseudomonadota bacterium]